MNPTPGFANGDLGRSVGLMIEEAECCYHELGSRGTEARMRVDTSTW